MPWQPQDAKNRLRRSHPGTYYVSAITIGELQKGVSLIERRDRASATAIGAWLSALRMTFKDRILPVSEEIALEWGRIAGMRSRGDADGLIAATALVHGFVLITRNVAHFSDTRAVILNPWDADRS